MRPLARVPGACPGHPQGAARIKEALGALLGDEASGLSPTAITRLTAAWHEECDASRQRDLSDRDYVYVWADGMHFRIRLEEDRLSALVLIGVRPDGTKELITVEDGYRESTIPGNALISNGPNSK